MQSPLLYHKVHLNHPEKPWVVFVHGAGGSSSVWFKQIRDFKANFNVLLLDLRGHGKSKNIFKEWQNQQRYTFKEVSDDIMQVLNHLNIQAAHFVGISLGTIIIRVLAESYPERIKSMIMGGAVIRFNARSKILLFTAQALKRFVPYMWLYQMYAWILMPRKKHIEARNLFVREAKKLYQKEFIRWIRITTNISTLMRNFREKEIAIPTLYLMGDEDYMFLPSVQDLVRKQKTAILKVIHNSGHVCNVDQPEVFNAHSISFIKGLG